MPHSEGMLLAIDIGNTNITMGVYDGDVLSATWRISTDVNKQADEYAVLFNGLLQNRGMRESTITEIVVCSVVPPLTGVFEEFCQNHFGLKPLVVGTGVKTGMRILYENPRDVGADRVADAVAAYHKYGGPVIVVGPGHCDGVRRGIQGRGVHGRGDCAWGRGGGGSAGSEGFKAHEGGTYGPTGRDRTDSVSEYAIWVDIRVCWPDRRTGGTFQEGDGARGKGGGDGRTGNNDGG